MGPEILYLAKKKYTIQGVLQFAFYFQLPFTNVTVGTSSANRSNIAKRHQF